MECTKCGSKMIKAVGMEGTISAETIYKRGFYTSTGIETYVCLECGLIERYATNSKVFTDSKYERINLEECSKR